MTSLYPGEEELRCYIYANKDGNLSAFCNANKENVTVWSSTIKAANAKQLFSVWKDRYIKLWKSKYDGRCMSVTMNDGLWESIFKDVTQILVTKDGYALQALKILQMVSPFATRLILRALEQEESVTTGSNSSSMASNAVEESAGGQEVSLDTDNRQDTAANENASDATCADIVAPAADDRLTIHGQDISIPFYAFQMVSNNNFNELEVETHVHHILALSSVMLVQNNRWHPDMVKIFTKDQLQAIYKDQQKMFKMGPYIETTFTKTTNDTLSDIVKKAKNGQMARMNAMINVYQLALSSSPTEAKLLKAVAKLIEKLPAQKLKDEIMETELCHRYLDPVLSGLFDDPEHDLLFRWTSVTNQEAKAGSGLIFKQRPDSVLTELDGLYFGRSLGFVEVKCTKEANNKFAVSKDLIRLGMQSKNALDKANSRGCLSIQIVGHEMTFFMTTLMADGLYAMHELLSVTTPNSLESLQAFISYFDELLAVVDCYEKWCVPSKVDDVKESRKRKTLPDEKLETITARPKSNKRRCFTSH